MLTYNSSILTKSSYWLNPVGSAPIPAHTPYLDLKFYDTTTNPTAKNYGRPDGNWVQLSVDPNVWRYYNDSSDWAEAFYPGTFGSRYGQYTVINESFDCVGYGYTNEIITMPGLFRNCKIQNCVTIDTSNCIDLASMFSTTTIRKIPYLPTSNCRDFNHFAADCNYLTEVEGLDTRKGECMVNMFRSCDLLSKLPPISLESANDTYVSVHNIAGPGCQAMFYSCPYLESITITGGSHINDWYGLNSDWHGGMFEGCSGLRHIYGNLDTSAATVTASMFYGCEHLLNLPFSFDVSHVYNMSYMFNNCQALTDIPTFTNIPNRSSFPAGTTLDWKSVLHGVINVGAGAYDLYQDLVRSGYTANSYTDVCAYFFTMCGSNTAGGAEDLSQIPIFYWGGTKEH